ncbi:MAG: FtsX-like permease family protein, partial [Bacteroidales bacterium]
NPPGYTLNNGTTMFYESAGEKRQLHLRAAPIDGDFFEVMQTRFLMGHAFLPTDSNKIVINEKCLQNMNVKDPIGIKIRHGFSNRDYEICGVIEDIQNLSLQNESSPAVYYLEPELWVFMVRLNPGDIRKTVAEMERLWKQVEPDQPFRLSFVDEDLQANYTREIRTRKLLTIMSLLAIFISMLGLYGLSMQIIQQRTKEIGIRKVNGATISEVLGMLNKRFLFWVVAAFIIAVPLTYYAMKKWLETFAYKTELSWWVFVLGGLVVLLVALATVSWQSWRAATKNPVEALRYE